MKKFLENLFVIVFILIGFALIIGWYLGVPLLAHMVYDKLSYGTYGTIWLSIHLVRNIHARTKAENELKKYQVINNILGGKF